MNTDDLPVSIGLLWDKLAVYPGMDRSALADMFNAIEVELDEKWMRLPLDSNGVPWHVGDTTENGDTVECIAPDGIGYGWAIWDEPQEIAHGKKPEDLDDVMLDMLAAFADGEMTPHEAVGAFRDRVVDAVERG